MLSFYRFLTKTDLSTECQGGEFAPTGIYSPRFNDIWSLGIILLNLATGRNPWKSATSVDPTFQAYLQDPLNFLPSVLPISPELNDILVRVLDVDWRRRMTLRQLRRAVENLDSFYADGVVFEGSLARCPWEVGADLNLSDEPSVGQRRAVSAGEGFEFKSRWSDDTDESDIVFTETTVAQDVLRHGPWSPMVGTPDPGRRTWLAETLGLSKFQEQLSNYSYEESTPSITHSPPSPYLSDGPSIPPTPENTSRLAGVIGRNAKPVLRHKLTIDTALVSKPLYYNSSNVTSFDGTSMSSSNSSSAMHTAVEQISYPSSFAMASSRGSDSLLQSPESIDLSSIVIPDKDLGVPWTFARVEPVAATATAMTEVTFASRYPSTQESYESVCSPVEFDSGTHGHASPRDYFAWPDFCDGKVGDGGGGRGAGEPYRLNTSQGSWNTRKERRMTSPDGRSFNFFARMGSGSPSPGPPHPQKSHDRRPSEPLVFTKLWHREDHGKGTLRRRLDHYLHPQNAQPPSAQPDSFSETSDREGYRRSTHARSTKPWFIPALFCHHQQPVR